MGFNIKGKIFKIQQEQQVTPTFKKRIFVLSYQDDYGNEQLLPMELLQEKTSLIDNFSEGEEVLIDFDLRGRKWVSPQGIEKFFMNIVVSDIVKSEELVPDNSEEIASLDADTDDLPF